MMRLTKRVFSAFLAFVMVFTMLPLDAWAADGTSDNSLVAPLAVPSGPEAVGLELDQSSAVIQIGGTAAFMPKVTMNDGTTQDATGCTWVSDHPEVAEVADGVVTGVAEGTATITCKLDNFETFAMVTVTEANYRLVYESAYPPDAMKYTYQNGDSASIDSATDTTVNETYEIGATATVASGIFTTINYDLVDYLGSDGETYNVGDTIIMNSNLTLTARWERNSNTTSKNQITVRYYKISNTSDYVDKTVTATFTSQEDNKATVTFITGNNQDTIVENYQDFYGWTIGGKEYSFNEQVTTTASWKSGQGEGYWLVEARPLRAGEEDNVVHAQFFIRKADADGYGEANQYYSVGSGTVDSTDFERNSQGNIISGTVAGSDNVNDNVNGYILTAPSAAQIANLMNITLKEASAVRWYVIKNQRDGFHVDGVIYQKDKYWRVEFVDPDTGKVVQTLLVEDADKIPVDQVISEDRLNNDLRDFTHWVDEEEEAVNLNDLVVTGDIRLTADFIRYSGYKVEYYLQNADDDDYTLDEERTETHKKEVNQQVSVIPQKIDGYNFKKDGSITSGKVTADETLVLKLYYDRETYQVTYSYTGEKPAEAPDEPAVETYKWGQTVTPETVTLPDGSYYVFDGWYKDGVKVDDTFVMPKSPVTLTGSFELNVPDTNVYWLKVNIYAGNQGSGKLIGSREMNNLTWEKLSDYYKMSHYEVANEFWGKTILDSNSELYTHRWTPSKADPAKTTDRGYHELDIYLKENAPAVVTVTYVGNGATSGTEPETHQGLVGDSYTIVDEGALKKDGYEFAGWNTQADGSGETFEPNTSITLESDLTLYAQWEQKVFTGTPITVRVVKDGNQVNAQEYISLSQWGDHTLNFGFTAGETYTVTFDYMEYDAADFLMSVDIPQGYHVAGVTSSKETTTSNQSGGTISFSATDTSSGAGKSWSLDNVPGGAVVTVTLVPNSHTVSYKYTDLSGNEHVFKEPVNHNFGTPVQVSTDVPQAPAGYHFSGWTTDDAKVTNGSFTMPDNDVVFVGNFKANDKTPYEVQWYYQNADGSYPTTTSVTDDRTGITGTTASVTTDDKAKTQNDLYVYDDENTDKVESATIAGDGSTVLKLYFKRAEFSVKYEYSNKVDGAPALPGEQNYKWGTTGIQVGTAPTLEGYVFSGWTTTDAKVENGSFEMPQKDVTFTGSWTKLYTVTYNPNGGVGSPYTVDVKDGENHTVLDNTTTAFTKTNYHFVGWNTKADGTGARYEKDDPINNITDNIILYAQWEIDEKGYTIEYYLDGDPVDSPYDGAPTGGSKKIGDTVNIKEDIQTAFKKVGSHYVLDNGAGNVFEITINADTTQNVLKVYYASDNKGGEEDPDTPDEIPDKYQVIFRYVAGPNGSITGITHETITKSDTVLTAQPTGTTVKADDGYKFQKWTRSTDSVEDTAEEMTTFKGISYNWGSDVTFTVHFTKLDNLSYTIHHYLVGTTVKVANDTTGTGTFQDTVQVEAATNFLAGYEKAKFASKTADTITITTGKNEATVYYKMPLTIKADDARRDYNGQPLTCGTFTVDGLVNGDKQNEISLSMTAESIITNVGTQPNVIDVSTVTGVEEYYEVTYKEGKLTIDPIDNLVVTISGNQKQEVYNGQTQNVSGYTAKFTVGDQEVTGVYDLEDFTYSGESTTASGKDAETYTVELDQTKFTWKDATNFTNVTFVVEKDIELTITPKPITVTAIDLTMDYGKTVPTPVINEEALAKQLATGDEIAVIPYTPYIDFKEADEEKPPVGTYDIKFQEENGVKGNYNVTYVPATLTVNAPSGFAYVEKSHENGTFASAGDEVTFNITVHNIYDVSADVVLREQPGVTFIAAEGATLSEGNTVLSTTLPPNESKTYQAKYTVTQADLRNGKIENTVDLTLTVGGTTINDTATDTVTGLQATATLAVEKTVQNPQASYGPGETITYNIKVTNTGNQTLTDVTLTDTLKANEAVVGNLTITGYDGPFELTPGEFKNFTVTYEVKESDLGKTLVNTATATGKDPDNEEVTETGKTDGEKTDTPSRLLEVTKVVLTDNGYAPSGKDENDNAVYALGNTIHYQITVTNTGNVTLQNVTLEDVLTLTGPDGTSKDVEIPVENGATFTLTRSGLEGSSKTFDVYYPVEESDLGKTLSNVATATSGETEDENEPVVVQTEDLKPSLSVTKTADRETAAVGDTISYTITVTNNGNQTLNGIQVTDDLTKETWEIKTLAPGKTSDELTTTYTVQVSDLVAGKVTNIATATVENGPTASGTAEVDVTGKLDISVNLASGKFPYDGEPHTVSGAKSVVYGGQDIPVNRDGTFAIDGTTFELTFVDDTGTQKQTDVNRDQDWAVSSYPVTATPADIKVTVDGSPTQCLNITDVNSGTLTIEPAILTVTTKSATGVYPTDTPLTATGECTGLQNGETLAFEVTGKQEFVGSSENTYTITWNGTAKKENYTIVEKLGTLTVTAPADYDYVQKTHVSTDDDGNKLTFDVGDTITFQITVHNIYDKPATVTLTEKLENVTFKENVEGVTLTAGETKTFEATYQVTQADVIKGKITNTVEWTLTPEKDQQITGEDKDEVTDLVYEPSLSVTKNVTSPAGTNGKYALGDTIEYQIVVKNDGNVDLTNIKLEDVLKATSTDAEGQPVTIEKEPDGWADQTFDLKVGGEKSITASYKVTEADLGKTLQNFATATAENPKEGEEDVTGTGNTPGEKTDSPNPKLDVEKTVENADGTLFKLGEEIRYKIVVTNTGNVTVNDINVTDEMTHKNGDGTLLTGGVLLDENDGPSNGVIEKLVPKGQEGKSSATFYYTYVVQESDLGKTIVNTATAAGNENKEDPGKGEVEVTPDARNPELKVVKTASTPKDNVDFALGETIDYTITLTNTGNVTLNVSIRDLFGTQDDASTVQEDITEKLICTDKDFNGTLKPEASVKYTYSYKVTEADLGKDIVNTVTYTAVDDTNVPAQQNEESVTEVTSQTDDPDPDLAVEKKVVKDAGYKPTGKDENGNDVYALDDVIHYRITVSNTGNVTLTGINVVDELKNSLDNAIETLNLPDGAKNFTLVPVGQPGGVSSKTFDVYYTVEEADLGKTLVNTVTAASKQTQPDPDDPNNDDHDETDGEQTEKPSPNMSVTKEVVDKQISYRVGDVITYKITVNNTGNTTIHNIKLTDVMQASGDVKFTSLDGGKLENGVPVRDSLAPKTAWVVTCQYTVQLADADSDGNVISNKVVVTSDGGPSDDAETSGEKIDPIYTVVIKYQNGAGADLHDPAVVKVHDGQKYSVDSPNVPGYHLTNANQKTVSGTLDADSPYISEEGVLTLVVVYARNPVEEDDDDPVVNPDNDPDETTEETEDEVDPGVYIEDPDDYTLTPITEEEPPLADLDVGDHTCCIMHFLLMLAAMVVLGFYTDSKKKHQARIFELKRTLAMEKGKNPDEDNSQQS